VTAATGWFLNIARDNNCTPCVTSTVGGKWQAHDIHLPRRLVQCNGIAPADVSLIQMARLFCCAVRKYVNSAYCLFRCYSVKGCSVHFCSFHSSFHARST
jgi:hypothetical protein